MKGYRKAASVSMLFVLIALFAAPSVSALPMLGVATGAWDRPSDLKIQTLQPCVTMETPRPGQWDVPVDSDIVIRFCVPVESSQIWWTITPAHTLLPRWSTDMQFLTMEPMTLWPRCTPIWFSITTEEFGTQTFHFTTEC